MGVAAGNTIGFILQMQDEMSPQFGPAERGYKGFVKNIEKYNKQAFTSSSKGMKAMGSLVKSFGELPRQALRSYDLTLKGLQKKVKAIKQPIEFVQTPHARKQFQGDISAAMVKAFSKVTLKLSAAMPTSRSRVFDQSTSLRKLYHKVPQPPDMVGKMKVPRLAQGGVMGQPRKVSKGAGPTTDDQLAVLARGEMVMPAKDTVKFMEIMTKAKSASYAPLPKDLSSSLSRLATAMDKVPRFASGRVPGDISVLAKGEKVTDAGKMAEIEGIAGRARGAGGAFMALPPDFVSRMARVENLMKAAPKHQEMFESGLDPHGLKNASNALREIEDLHKLIIQDTKQMGAAWQKKFLPYLSQSVKSAKDLKGAVEGALTPTQKLLKALVAPAQYMALTTALDKLKSGFNQTHEAVAGLADSAGAHHVTGWINVMNESNKVLGLSRTELGKFQDTATAAFRELPATTANLDEFQKALSGLVTSGAGKKLSLQLAGPLSQLATATGEGVENMTALSATLSFKLHKPAGEIVDLMAEMSRSAKTMEVPLGHITSTVNDLALSSQSWLGGLSGADANRSLATMGKMEALFQSKGISGATSSFMAGVTNPEQAGMLSGMTGLSSAAAQRMLASGDIQGIMSAMQKQLGQFAVMPADQRTAAIGSYSQSMGLDPQMVAAMVSNLGDFSAGADDLSKIMVKAGTGMDYVRKQASDTMTWYQKLGNAITTTAKQAASWGPIPGIIDVTTGALSGLASTLQTLAAVAMIISLGGPGAGILKGAMGMGGKVLGKIPGVGAAGGFLGKMFGGTAAAAAPVATTAATALPGMLSGGAGQAAGGLMSSGASSAVGGALSKTALKTGVTKGLMASGAKGLLAKVPVLGPAIAGALTLASGGSIGHAISAAVGTGIGALLGSAFGPVGTLIGGTLGGMVGEYAGQYFEPTAPTTANTPATADTVSGVSHIDIGTEIPDAIRETNRILMQILSAVDGGALRAVRTPATDSNYSNSGHVSPRSLAAGRY